MKMMLEYIKKYLWPEVCPFCGKVYREGICPACRKKLEQLIVKEPKCMKCGKPVSKKEQEYCRDCMHTYHYYDRGIGLWLHKKPVSISIYQFKYHNQRAFGKYYAKEMMTHYGMLLRRWNPDLIIPIPLHIRRKRKRGYNQAMLVASELGKLLGVPVEEKAVKRIRYTDPQKKLDNKRRKANLKHAFRAEKSVKGVKRVLLIDDIYTTGNTIDAVSKVLKDAGVEKVYFLTISIGQGY